jgi:putative transposase
VQVPRDRKGEFNTQVIPRSKQYEDSLREDLCVMFLGGVSTRTLGLISERLIGRRISASEVSKASAQLTRAVEAWRQRDLSAEAIKYMYVDGTLFSMRLSGSVEKVPVLTAIGVSASGHRTVLGLQSGDKESATNWREFFKDLKKRGLDPGQVVLGIMDGLPGLERIFKQEFSNAKVQRCQIHVARNVLAKVPRKLKRVVADEIRSIFYASSKDKALGFFQQFKARWEKQLPVNKEFKRRTKPMEIVAGERSCYTLLAFVCLKMELRWRSKPIGKVANNLPFMKKLAEENFTQFC